MAKRVRGDFGDGAFDLVTWVPLHRKKFRRRGFCQTELLARELSRRLGAPAKGGLLAHTGKGGAQARQEGAAAREHNAREAFSALPGRGDSRGRRVLLVDDVLTTGATARRCAELLKKAGAGEVRLAVAATTPAGQRKMAANGGRR